MKFVLTRLCKYFISPIFQICYQALCLNEKFGAEFIREYQKEFEKYFEMKPQDVGSENYWLSYCYIRSQSPHLDAAVRNFLHMYSFARNVCSAMYISLIVVIILNIWKYSVPQWLIILWGLSLLLTALLLLIRYYYLYSSYYSKFIFRSFLAISKANRMASLVENQPDSPPNDGI